MWSRVRRAVYRYGACLALFALRRAVRPCGTGRRADDAAWGRIGFLAHRPARHRRGIVHAKCDAFGRERCVLRIRVSFLHRA